MFYIGLTLIFVKNIINMLNIKPVDAPINHRFFKEKFGRVLPSLYGVKVKSLSSCAPGHQEWGIAQSSQPSIDIRHYIPPRQNQVNEPAYLNEHPFGIPAQAQETLIYLTPSPFTATCVKHLLLGAHKNGQVSVMVIFKQATQSQFINTLERHWQDENTLDNNGFVVSFADRVGMDQRPRAAVWTHLMESRQVIRLESLLAHIHALCPMNNAALFLCKDFIHQAHQCNVQLSIEPSLNISRWWSPRLDIEKTPYNITFPRYPNYIPDIPADENIVQFEPTTTLQFPETLPEIHRCIVNNKPNHLREIVSHNPMTLYQRNIQGHLPIEAALYCCKSTECAYIIYKAWQSLPIKMQYAHSLFYNAANLACDIEFNNPYGYDPYELEDRVPIYLQNEQPTQQLGLHVSRYAQTYRPCAHLDAIQGKVPPIEIFIKEKQDFNAFQERLSIIAKHAIAMCTTPIHRKNKGEVLNHIFHTTSEFHTCIEQYKTQCLQGSQPHFLLFCTLLCCINLQDAILSLKPNVLRCESFIPVRTYLSSNTIRPSLTRLLNYGITSPTLGLALVRSGLLQHLEQDLWGYTPLALAIMANQFDYVTPMLSAQLFESIIYPLHCNHIYALIDCAQSREMHRQLLSAGISANKRCVSIKNPIMISDSWAGEYGWRPTRLNDAYLTPVERLFSENSPELSIRQYQNLFTNIPGYLPQAPYNFPISDNLLSSVNKHAASLEKKRAYLRLLPKVAGLPRLNNKQIQSTLMVSNQPYITTTVLMKTLSQCRKMELASLFSRCFFIENYRENRAKPMDFFMQSIANDLEYYIQILTHSESKIILGALLFKIIRNTSDIYGTFHIFYGSIAMMNPDCKVPGYIKYSLFSSIISAYTLSQNCNTKLYFYSRFGQPGIAYTFVPQAARPSSKYLFPTKLHQYIANVVGHDIEPNGLSIPPVLSRASCDNAHPRIAFYHYLLHEVHKNPGRASLPIVYEVTEKCWRELTKEVADNHSARSLFFKHYTQQLISVSETTTMRAKL